MILIIITVIRIEWKIYKNIKNLKKDKIFIKNGNQIKSIKILTKQVWY